MFTIHCPSSLQLPKMFPGLLVSLQVYAREVPLFSFLPGAVCLDLKGAVKAFAIQPNGTQTPLFKLNVVSTYISWPMNTCVFMSFSFFLSLFYSECQRCIKVVG